MQEIKEFQELEKKLSNDLLTLIKDDKDIEDKLMLEDNHNLSMNESEERFVCLIETLLDKGEEIKEKKAFEFLFKILEKENIFFPRILRIFKKSDSEFLDEILKEYLQKNENLNRILINVSILHKNIKICNNKELQSFLEMNPDFFTYNFLKTYFNLIEIPSLKILLNRLLRKEKNIFFYKIFSTINLKTQNKFLDFFEENVEQEEDFILFINSLMVDEETVKLGFEKISNFDYFSALNSAFKSLIKLSKQEEKYILPSDEKFAELILIAVLKISDQSFLMDKKLRNVVLTIAENFYEVLKLKISLEIKSLIYQILRKLKNEEEVFRKVSEFLMTDFVQKIIFLDFENEKIEKNFDCTNNFLNMACDYKNKRIKEFCAYVITSEEPKIISSVLKIYENEGYKIENLSVLKHLKQACLKDSTLINCIINYCISLNFVLHNVELTRIIMSYDTPNFFKYVELFEDFSIYLSNDFLKRISENKIEGLKCLLNMKNISDFIIKNRKYFNSLVKVEKEEAVNTLIIQIYNKITSLNSNYEFSFTNEKTILIPKIYCSYLFILISKLLINLHLQNKKNSEYVIDEILVNEEDLKDFCNYLKVLIILKHEIKINEIVKLYSNKHIDDLIGFYRCYFNCSLDSISLKSRIFEERKDNSLFITKFESADKFTKFLFFKTIDISKLKNNDKIHFERILKLEILKLKNEGLNSQENVLLLKFILNFLLLLDNINCCVKILDEFCFIPQSLIQLCMEISIKNLCNGGSCVVKCALKNSCVDLQVKYLLVCYLKGKWSLEMYNWFLSVKNMLVNSKEVEYLVGVLDRK